MMLREYMLRRKMLQKEPSEREVRKKRMKSAENVYAAFVGHVIFYVPSIINSE